MIAALLFTALAVFLIYGGAAAFGATGAIFDVADAWRGDITVERFQKNCGSALARNRAVELAAGDWIFMLDADNVLPPGLLASLSEVAEEGVIVTPEAIQYFEDVRWLHRWTFDHLDRRSIITEKVSPAASGNFLFPRSIFEQVGGYYLDVGAYDSWAFGVACSLAGAEYRTVPESFYLHRLHAESYWLRRSQSGEIRRDLYQALCHFPDAYGADTFEALNPENPDYPSEPFDAIR